MDLQDYEYYEARAEDVKLEDITSSQQNADILERLRDNDPKFTYITYIYIAETVDDGGDFVIREGDNLGWLGYFIGRSKQVKTLYIDYFPDNLNIDAFYGGLGHNRSIESLCISTDIGEDFKSLGPLLRNNSSLRVLTFSNFDIGLLGARNIALLLGQQSSLKCLNFEETNLGDETFVEMATALSKQPQIEELHLSTSNIGRNGCVALGNALEGMRNPNLATLDLGHNNIDDEGLHALVGGLINCHNLTSLYLHRNELSTCCLEHLDLEQTNMDNDGVAVLAAGLARLPTLKKLDLSNNRIGDQGLQALVGGLGCCNLLEELYLSRNMLLGSGLGMRSLGTFVQRTNMQSLFLSDTVNDEGLQCLVDGMANCDRLKKLALSYNNNLMTAVGLRSLSSLFRSERCTLCNLLLGYLDDDGAIALANGLIGNKSLKTVEFSRSGITERGWTAFSKLLCDTSSVNNTYLSNHTLETLGGYGVHTPSDIMKYLKLNRVSQKNAALRKILDSHPDIDVEPLFQWKLKCLPLVVRWLESARSHLYLYHVHVRESNEVFQCRKLSAVYKFIHGLPSLAVAGYRGQNMTDILSKKRKFDHL
ncbi:leucine-rich repeat protein [Skeletonema marinoi]|uniref:Leucine-rich repeat protein n=1 Tax=Skeletonema marinoi TaxID=267567 RepID=A0AAD8XV84_9STRA|nr:leucine-rich repeat protein [Skeletonema marinoi]